MTRRTRVALAVAIVVDVVASIVVLAAGVGVVGFAILAVAGVAAISWAFYEVGASEDRDRAQGRS